MQMIPIALAAPDMVLARDIRRNENAQVPPICGRGTVLTASLIERLINMGIKSLTVEGHPVAVEGEKTLEDLLADLDHRFSKVANVPLMGRLKEIYRKNIIRSMGGEGGE